jgi:hypothetical protein
MTKDEVKSAPDLDAARRDAENHRAEQATYYDRFGTRSTGR